MNHWHQALSLVMTFGIGWAIPGVTEALVGAPDLSAAWQRFLLQDASREPVRRFPYEHCFRKAAARHNMPLVLLLAVARGESDFDPMARSNANAHGLMQILWPDTARELGLQRLSELRDPCKNVDAGTRYLKQLMGRYGNDLHLALAAYNYGPRRIPVNARRIPRGAEWYSGYIYRHLNYVLGQRAPRKQDLVPYDDEGKLELLVFRQPYRAAAFVRALKTAQPGLRLDWFKEDSGRFRVLLLYADASELKSSKQRLAQAGFRFD